MSFQKIATDVGLNLLERAIDEIPELLGILTRGLADEPNVALVEQVKARLPQLGASAQAAAELRALRAKQGGQ